MLHESQQVLASGSGLGPEKLRVMAGRNRTPNYAGADAEKNTDPAPAHDWVNQNPAAQGCGPSVGATDREANADLELNDKCGPRRNRVSATAAAYDYREPCDDLSWAPVTHPFAGPLLRAAQEVLEIFDGHMGLRDDEYLPVVAARRIVFGQKDGFVAAFDVSEARKLIRLGSISADDETQDGDIFGRPVLLSRIETELGAGLRLLGRLALNGQAPPIGGQAVEVSRSTVPSSSDETSAASKVISQSMPVPLETSLEVIALTVAKFAKRWGYSKRYIETCLRQGLPKCGEGRGRRIPIAEGDAWMRLHRDPLARRASEAAKRHSMPNKTGSRSGKTGCKLGKEGPDNAGS